MPSFQKSPAAFVDGHGLLFSRESVATINFTASTNVAALSFITVHQCAP